MKPGWVLALGCAFALSGCSSSGGTDYDQYFAVLKQVFASGFGAQGITKEQAAAVPYASMGYRIDGGDEHLIVLGTDTSGDELWTSADHVVLLTHDGRIRRTVGLPHDLSALASSGGAELTSPASALKAPFSTVRQADFQDIGLYSVPIRCQASAKGPQNISILGANVPTIRVDETCRSDILEWSFTDSFWVNPQSGLVWRSVQHIHPHGETVATEIFRPPASQ